MDNIDNNVELKKFNKMAIEIFKSMGLIILEHSKDYFSDKPDFVAIYTDKDKYYIIEVISESCIGLNSSRFNIRDKYKECRDYCKRLFVDNELYGAIASAIICDLSVGLENFNFKSVNNHQLSLMSRYSGLVIPSHRIRETSEVLDRLNIKFRSLNIVDKFIFILISQDDTLRLADTNKFIEFILNNR